MERARHLETMSPVQLILGLWVCLFLFLFYVCVVIFQLFLYSITILDWFWYIITYYCSPALLSFVINYYF